MFDFIDNYAAQYAADLRAQDFWYDVFALMSDGYTEDRALKTLDSKGERRASYPRPEGFPGCFAESA